MAAMSQNELTWHATAASHLLEARRKNGRIGGRKSRFGCATCKARRLKCDETKPACKRCLSTGRNCEGYPEMQQKSKNVGSLIGTQLSQSLGLREKDRRTFDFFLSWTAPRLAGSLDKEFWCGYVLQLAQTEPVVLDSLLAISTLYEHPQYMHSFRTTRDLSGSPSRGREKIDLRTLDRIAVPPKVDENHMNALRAYNRAIETFRRRMNDGNATPLLVLLSCVLFICIEVIRDNVFAAITLYTNGFNMIKQYDSVIANEQEQSLVTLIKLIFKRLSVIAATFGHTASLNAPLEFVIVEQHTPFASMADARTALFDLMTNSHAFLRDAATWKDAYGVESIGTEKSPSEGDNGAQDRTLRIDKFGILCDIDVEGMKKTQNIAPSSEDKPIEHTMDSDIKDTINQPYQDKMKDVENLFEKAQLEFDRLDLLERPYAWEDFASLPKREANLLNRLDQWLQAFQCLRKSEDVDSTSASQLLMYYHSFYTWLRTRLSPTETIFDEYTNQFGEIVRHAETYINSKANEKPIFTFEIGAIPPLFFTAMKCRIPSLRRLALDLLSRAPRKECTWGANSTAELACRLMSIEEEGLNQPTPNCSGRCAMATVDDTVVPPESARIHQVELLMNNVTGAHEIRVTRYTMLNGRLQPYVQDFRICDAEESTSPETH